MTEIKKHDPGMFCWVELATSDGAAAKKFYTSLFGYFAVEDCDRTVEKAKSAGAKVMMPPMDIENIGRFSILTDPQGAGFAVIKLNPMPA